MAKLEVQLGPPHFLLDDGTGLHLLACPYPLSLNRSRLQAVVFLAVAVPRCVLRDSVRQMIKRRTGPRSLKFLRLVAAWRDRVVESFHKFLEAVVVAILGEPESFEIGLQRVEFRGDVIEFVCGFNSGIGYVVAVAERNELVAEGQIAARAEDPLFQVVFVPRGFRPFLRQGVEGRGDGVEESLPDA